MVKGLKVFRKDGKKEAEKLLVDIGAKVNIKGVRGMGGKDRKLPRVWVIQLGNGGKKREVMELKGELVWIEEDKT